LNVSFSFVLMSALATFPHSKVTINYNIFTSSIRILTLNTLICFTNIFEIIVMSCIWLHKEKVSKSHLYKRLHGCGDRCVFWHS